MSALVEALLFSFVYSYIKIAYLTRWMGHRMKGIGYFARHLIRQDRIIRCGDHLFYLNHKIAGSYGVMIAGYWNELETHIFIHALLAGLTKPVSFIDVGANIGEMMIDVASSPHINSVLAIEPHPECAAACRRSVELNRFGNVAVRQIVISSEKKQIHFSIDARRPNASCISDKAGAGVCYDASTLDIETRAIASDAIILIDVEGAELDVIRGGREFINKSKPLIIFEYNQISKQHFGIEDIIRELGPQYSIYRLRSSDGRLDNHVHDAWNCVAVHEGSIFNNICTQLLCRE
jgi:FkbM family methyltransferase